MDFYLRAGKWTRWFDGEDGKPEEMVKGLKWVSEMYNLHGLRLFVREGAQFGVGSRGRG